MARPESRIERADASPAAAPRSKPSITQTFRPRAIKNRKVAMACIDELICRHRDTNADGTRDQTLYAVF